MSAKQTDHLKVLLHLKNTTNRDTNLKKINQKNKNDKKIQIQQIVIHQMSAKLTDQKKVLLLLKTINQNINITQK